MPFGLPEDAAPPMADEEDVEGSDVLAAPEEDPEVQRLASEAFPGVEVNAGALKELLRHCMDQYGPGSEEVIEDDAPDKGGLLALTFGKPKTK